MPDEKNSSKIDPYASLQIKDFRRFILARTCVVIATQIQATVVGWQVYEITHDALSLGLIGMAPIFLAVGRHQKALQHLSGSDGFYPEITDG